MVIVDEFSQLPTREAEVVLAAAAACPGGQVWLVGDPLQAQPVGAGGLAPWLPNKSRQGRGAGGRADVNRRQADPDRTAGPGRSGPATSRPARSYATGPAGSTTTPTATRPSTAMAAAVLADIDVHGPERVAALAVTHADCEALADRIRADLAAQGVIAGAGPGGTGLGRTARPTRPATASCSTPTPTSTTAGG